MICPPLPLQSWWARTFSAWHGCFLRLVENNGLVTKGSVVATALAGCGRATCCDDVGGGVRAGGWGPWW